MINSAQHTDFTKEFTRSQRLLYRLLYGTVYLHSLLPMWVLFRLSDLLYLVLYRLVGYRKAIVRKNLRESFPEKGEEELREIEVNFYHWFCDYIYETIKLTSISKDEMRLRVTYHNLEYVNRHLADGHNVALYLAHYCNWEWVTSIGLHLPGSVAGGQVYHPLKSPVFNALLLKLRSRMGTESVAMAGVLRRFVQFRRDKMPFVFGFISDQIPMLQSTHYWTNFLSHPDTLVITGTERLAKQFDAVCVYLDISRPRRGYYDITVVPMAEHTHDVPDWQLTEQYFRLLEKTIQHTPEYWLWTHNRWKRDLDMLHSFNEAMKKEMK